ncbi:MAG: hypothetical protein IPI36_07155 [Chitinophagaceae bacterium]|nr:hypothetical protein [Chitinophagaceae bacterium]
MNDGVNADLAFSSGASTTIFLILPFRDFFFATGNNVGETVYSKSKYMLAINKAQTIPIGILSHLLLPQTILP